jgi:hypothetical protein
MCNACRLYEKQSKFIDEALKKHSDGSSKKRIQEQPLPKEIKERIIRNL